MSDFKSLAKCPVFIALFENKLFNKEAMMNVSAAFPEEFSLFFSFVLQPSKKGH